MTLAMRCVSIQKPDPIQMIFINHNSPFTFQPIITQLFAFRVNSDSDQSWRALLLGMHTIGLQDERMRSFGLRL